jgi:hypothetical protein
MVDLPDDDNGAVLRRMQDSGDDLSKPRDINFSVVFKARVSAEQFMKKFDRDECELELEFISELEDNPWNVTVTKFMLPDYRLILDMELELAQIADPLGGHNDGWGAFSMM